MKLFARKGKNGTGVNSAEESPSGGGAEKGVEEAREGPRAVRGKNSQGAGLERNVPRTRGPLSKGPLSKEPLSKGPPSKGPLSKDQKGKGEERKGGDRNGNERKGRWVVRRAGIEDSDVIDEVTYSAWLGYSAANPQNGDEAEASPHLPGSEKRQCAVAESGRVKEDEGRYVCAMKGGGILRLQDAVTFLVLWQESDPSQNQTFATSSQKISPNVRGSNPSPSPSPFGPGSGSIVGQGSRHDETDLRQVSLSSFLIGTESARTQSTRPATSAVIDSQFNDSLNVTRAPSFHCPESPDAFDGSERRSSSKAYSQAHNSHNKHQRPVLRSPNSFWSFNGPPRASDPRLTNPCSPDVSNARTSAGRDSSARNSNARDSNARDSNHGRDSEHRSSDLSATLSCAAALDCSLSLPRALTPLRIPAPKQVASLSLHLTGLEGTDQRSRSRSISRSDSLSLASAADSPVVFSGRLTESIPTLAAVPLAPLSTLPSAPVNDEDGDDDYGDGDERDERPESKGESQSDLQSPAQIPRGSAMEVLSLALSSQVSGVESDLTDCSDLEAQDDVPDRANSPTYSDPVSGSEFDLHDTTDIDTDNDAGIEPVNEPAIGVNRGNRQEHRGIDHPEDIPETQGGSQRDLFRKAGDGESLSDSTEDPIVHNSPMESRMESRMQSGIESRIESEMGESQFFDKSGLKLWDDFNFDRVGLHREASDCHFAVASFERRCAQLTEREIAATRRRRSSAMLGRRPVEIESLTRFPLTTRASPKVGGPATSGSRQRRQDVCSSVMSGGAKKRRGRGRHTPKQNHNQNHNNNHQGKGRGGREQGVRERNTGGEDLRDNFTQEVNLVSTAENLPHSGNPGSGDSLTDPRLTDPQVSDDRRDPSIKTSMNLKQDSKKSSGMTCGMSGMSGMSKSFPKGLQRILTQTFQKAQILNTVLPTHKIQRSTPNASSQQTQGGNVRDISERGKKESKEKGRKRARSSDKVSTHRVGTPTQAFERRPPKATVSSAIVESHLMRLPTSNRRASPMSRGSGGGAGGGPEGTTFWSMWQSRRGGGRKGVEGEGKEKETLMGSATYAPHESSWALVSGRGEAEIRMMAVSTLEAGRALLEAVIAHAKNDRRKALHVLLPIENQSLRAFYAGLKFQDSRQDYIGPHGKRCRKFTCVEFEHESDRLIKIKDVR